MMLISSRFFVLPVLLITALAQSPAHAQEANTPVGNEIVPAAEASAAADGTAPDQPESAFKSSSSSGKTDAPAKKAAAPKKKTKKPSADFKKKHSVKKKAKAPPPKDPSVSEPTEDIQAIKNRAEQQFWDGKRDAPTPAEPVALPGGASLERASASQLAGVTFDDQPLRMPESESFRRSIDTVAFELGRPCRAREFLGWPLQQTEQTRVDRIFGETIEKFRQRGFTVLPHLPKAAGADISVFTADRTTGEFDRHILGLWSAGDVGLLLMLCDTEAPPGTAKKAAPEKEKKAAPVKSKPKKVTAKPKKAAPKKEPEPKIEEEVEPKAEAVPPPPPAPPSASEGERPVVLPGVAPAETPAAPAQ
jgi:hypothetical protein